MGVNRDRGRRPAALILDAEYKQALVAVRALGRAGIETIVADTRTPIPSSLWRPALASRWCSGRAVLPDVGEGADVLVERVIALSEDLDSPVIISSHDGTIEALRSRRSAIEQVGRLAIASDEALSMATDKAATLALARRLGIAAPETRVVRELSAAPEAINEIGVPVVVKAVRSWMPCGSGGWWAGPPAVARTPIEAMASIKRLIDHGVPALVQPWLSGSRDAIGIFLADRQVVAKFAVRSSRMFPLVGGVSVVRETIPMPADIGTMAEALVRAMSLEGYAEVEFRRDSHGRPFLMEVNPRLNGGVELAVRAGVSVPLLLYRWAAGAPLEPVLSYQVGRRMRDLNMDVSWLAGAVRDPHNPDSPGRMKATGVFLAEFARPAAYDHFDRSDLRPALPVFVFEMARAARIVRRVFRMVLGHLPRPRKVVNRASVIRGGRAVGRGLRMADSPRDRAPDRTRSGPRTIDEPSPDRGNAHIASAP